MAARRSVSRSPAAFLLAAVWGAGAAAMAPGRSVALSGDLSAGLRCTGAARAAVRTTVGSSRSSICWTDAEAGGATDEAATGAGADTGTATFSMAAAPCDADAGSVRGWVCGAAGATATRFCRGVEAHSGLLAGDTANFTPKYKATAASAASDIHNTRRKGRRSRDVPCRGDAPSMVAKMLGPKSGCPDDRRFCGFCTAEALNSWGRVPRPDAGCSGWVMTSAATPQGRQLQARARRERAAILERPSPSATPGRGKQQSLLTR